MEEAANQKLTVFADLSQGVATDTAPIRQRTDRGTFARGNQLAKTHGLYATRITEALVAERQAFERASLADDGQDVPVRRASRHRYRARVHVQIEALSESLEQFGLFDRRGRLRAGWLQRLESLVGLAVKLDVSLGDERQPRSLTAMSAAEWIATQQPAGQE